MAQEQQKIKLGFAENFFLSGCAAVTSKTIAAPIERVKMVVQNCDEMVKQGVLKKPFNGITDTTQWIMKNEGVGAFWRSNFTNCLRYFPTQALNFAFKDAVKKVPFFAKNKVDGNFTRLAKNVTAGGLAGGGSLCFVYSLDYARTRLANDMKAAGSDTKRKFTGLLDVYKQTIKADGIAGLYRGFVISFVGIFVYRGFYFGLYDTIMPMLGENAGLGVSFVVGYGVTVAAGLASYPIDTIRRRMMMTSGTGTAYSGSIDCAAQILKQEGVKSFFKGAGANILRGVAGAGVLAGFDVFKREYVKARYGQNAVLA